jgi:hypothetical protein
MTNPRKSAVTRLKARSLETYAELVKAGGLKNRDVYLVDHVEEQMLLPTMDVYLSTQISMPAVSGKLASRSQRHKAPATVQVWERLF